MTSDRCTYAKNDWEFQPLKIQNHKNHKNHNCHDVSEHFHTTTWLGSITFYVLAQQLFGASASFFVSACHSSTVNAYNNLVSTKNHPLAMWNHSNWMIFLDFNLKISVNTEIWRHLTFSQKNARLSSPSIWLSTLTFRVNLVSIICNFSCSTIGRSAAPKRSHSPDTGL